MQITHLQGVYGENKIDVVIETAKQLETIQGVCKQGSDVFN